MSVAQKDGIKAADGISYDDLYRRWEQSNWQATAIDFSADREGWAGAHRHPAALGAVDLLDVLLRRGLGHRQPLPLHRRGAEGGAEVLPRHPAGRRGAPRGLLPPLLQGGDRGRRLDRLDPRLHRVAARLGLPQRLRPARPDGRRPAPATARCPTSPARSRSTTWSSRRRSPSPASTSSRTTSPTPGRCPASARGWRTSRATSSATSASGSRCSPSASPSRTSARQAVAELLREVLPVHARGLLAGRDWRPRVHPLLRLRARGHLRLRAALGADQVARDRLPDRGDARRAAGRPRARPPRRSRRARSRCSRPA